MSGINPKNFLFSVENRVARVALNRPEKKNPLTFESYAELRDLFRALPDHQNEIRAVLWHANEGNFCSGGDVHEIIGPLLERTSEGRKEFAKMTTDLIIAMRKCPQVIVAAIDGVCVGAGAAIAMACDYRMGSEESKVAFLFTKVGLAGCDMGACTILPRIIGVGRASELLYTGRSMTGKEARDWGFYNRCVEPNQLYEEGMKFARKIADGPTRAHQMTKKMLNREWSMDLFEAIEAEALAQAECMETQDFRRAYEAFVEKRKPEFQGN